MAFARKPYVSLEPLDVRDYAREDPRGFLAEYPKGAILDEIQHVPELSSYIQTEVDALPTPGRFILTGSQNFALSETVSQSLAGRTAVLHLFAPSLKELKRFPSYPKDLIRILWTGAYPRIYDRNIPASRWLADYVATYIQRDVRQVLNIGDLTAFSTFLKLMAGRTAQELNLSGLGSDAGVSHNTVRSWLSILEASFICFRLPSWQSNLRKQVIKAPKVHFVDSGLICCLLGIRTPEELRHHPLRGAIFESWVASEIYKAYVHRGETPRLFHFRDAKGLEVDLVLDGPQAVHFIEVKSGSTINPDFFLSLRRIDMSIRSKASGKHVGGSIDPIGTVIYGGDKEQRRSDARVVPWHKLDRVTWS
jgi:predicted AAA+ superfamily ATPase